jgi:hypothetical protein
MVKTFIVASVQVLMCAIILLGSDIGATRHRYAILPLACVRLAHSHDRPEHPPQVQPSVGITKQNVPLREIRLSHSAIPPAYLLVWSLGDDK